MSEIWRDIKDFENYQISNLGNVRSIRGNKPKLLKKSLRWPQEKSKTREKYLAVTLSQNGERKSFAVHRLVAEAFIPNPDNFPMVNHKNGIKDDNRVENLEWCTNQYNVLHSVYVLGNKLKYGAVNQFTKEGIFIKRFNNIREACEEVGGSYKNIKACAKGKRNIANGYIWRFDGYIAEDVVYNNKVKKKVIQLSPSGKYIATYDSFTDASKATNLSADSIAKCCDPNSQLNRVGNYIWRLVENYNPDEFAIFNGKKINEYTPHGVLVCQHDSIESLIKERGYDLIKIYNVVNGISATAYRRIWRVC